MKYLDYLTDYTYDELPAEVRTTVGRDDYDTQRRVALGLAGAGFPLPPPLAQAFREQTIDVKILNKAKVRPAISRTPAKRRFLPWLAAAGWLLFLTVGAYAALRTPPIQLVQKTVLAPAPPPEIIYRTDTVTQYVNVVRYRERTVRDTVYHYLPGPERLVVVRDTVFGVRPVAPVAGGSSMRGREWMLQFLSEGE